MATKDLHSARVFGNIFFMSRILLVDDDESILAVLRSVLKTSGHEIVTALGGTKGKQVLLSGEPFDLMISDIRMDEVNGMQLLEIAHKNKPDLPVIMLTAYAQLDTATQALKLGAFDYMLKPFKLDQLMLTIKKALDYNKAIHNQSVDSTDQTVPYEFEKVVAQSKDMKNVCELIRRAGPIDIPIVIYGERGTGKKLVATTIHEISPRKAKKILTINCANLPEPVLDLMLFGYAPGSAAIQGLDEHGYLERATGGSLILEEVETLPNSLQNKLSVAIVEKKIRRNEEEVDTPIDVRIMATSSLPLEGRVDEGMFLKELCSLLNLIPIEMKPIRERPEDVRPLIRHVLRQLAGGVAKAPSVDNEVYTILESYPWPGNVSEIRTVLQQSLPNVKDGKLIKTCLPPKIAATPVHELKSSATKELEEFRGRSLREFIQSKQKQYLDNVKQLGRQAK